MPSTFAKETFLQKGVEEKKISIVPYGVDVQRYHPVDIEKDKKFRVIYLGGLSIRKGIHYLANAFKYARIPNSELVLIGKEYPETSRLLGGVDSKNILRLGILPSNKVLKWLSKSNVFVLPSIEDGFGLVIREAQACGLPVIATKNSGGPDCIVDGIDGFTVDAKNYMQIAEKITYLYENPDVEREMKKNSLLSAKDARGWGDYGYNIINIYNKIING